MPKISDEIIRAVTDAAKIEDVVADFVTLRKAGVNLTGICPFHNDQHDGNFIVRPSTIPEARGGNTYRCFVCDAKGGPVQFLMNAEHMTFPDAIRWLGKKYGIEVDDTPLDWTPPPPRPTPPPPPALEIPRSWVRRTMDVDYNRNIFTYWFMMLPWDNDQRKRLPSTLWQYCVGGWQDGRVVFWQIDHTGKPRAAKLMRYLQDGHRDKTAHPGWIYNQDGCRQQLDPDNHTILKPLFGSHLLTKYPEAAVNIVESEKTALVMANYYGNLDKQLWLACGGLQHMNLEAMQVLIDQGRKVWLWPDKDGREQWNAVCDKLGSDCVNVFTKFFDSCWVKEDGDKADVADIAIRMMRTGDKPRKEEPEPETIVKWEGEQPFLDAEELFNPRLHEMRMIMSRCHSKKWLKAHHLEIVDDDEIIKRYPILEPLFNNENYEQTET
jgi:hypothetical protein